MRTSRDKHVIRDQPYSAHGTSDAGQIRKKDSRIKVSFHTMEIIGCRKQCGVNRVVFVLELYTVCCKLAAPRRQSCVSVKTAAPSPLLFFVLDELLERFQRQYSYKLSGLRAGYVHDA